MDLDEAAKALREFVEVVKALRTPGTGCPWDLEQDHRTLRPYLIEEAHEVLEAIDRGNDRGLRDELGDLLLQVVLHAQVADDRGAFSITDVARGITEKMVRRHPHVFGSVKVNNADDVRRNWEEIKAAERQAAPEASALARLPASLPALLLAQRLGEKLARDRAGHSAPAEQLAKLRQAIATLEAEAGDAAAGTPATRRASDGQRARLEDALGELLFRACQLAGSLGLSAEDSLRASCRRLPGQSPP